MVKDGKGQPAQPSNSEEIKSSGYNGQCFVNGTCSDGHLLRATNAENLKVHMIQSVSRVQKSIENWSVWSKMALGEVIHLMKFQL